MVIACHNDIYLGFCRAFKDAIIGSILYDLYFA